MGADGSGCPIATLAWGPGHMHARTVVPPPPTHIPLQGGRGTDMAAPSSSPPLCSPLVPQVRPQAGQPSGSRASPAPGTCRGSRRLRSLRQGPLASPRGDPRAARRGNGGEATHLPAEQFSGATARQPTGTGQCQPIRPRIPHPTPRLLSAAASAPCSRRRGRARPATPAQPRDEGCGRRLLLFLLLPLFFKSLTFKMTRQAGAALPMGCTPGSGYQHHGAPVASGGGCPIPGVPSMPGRASRPSASPQIGEGVYLASVPPPPPGPAFTGPGGTGWGAAGAAPASRCHISMILKVSGKWCGGVRVSAGHTGWVTGAGDSGSW